MKRINLAFAVTATVLGLALTFATAVPAVKAAPAQPTAAMAAPDEHPELHDALNSLRHAREHIEKAKHDFGGHRDEALHATDEAIRQLEVCLKYEQ